MRISLVLAAAALMAGAAVRAETVRQEESLKAGREAYEASEYAKAAQLLQQASAQNPRSGEILLLLAKTYYESQQHDAAIATAEKAVSLDPQSSVYHEWLGKVYGEKADHAAMFSALSLARKARREFERAVELDPRNFSAQQALIEFDCSAPGIAGGGEDKARTEIAKLAAMDAAEGHYAAGNCRRQKKDFVAADTEFDKALENHPKSADLIFDIGDYAVKHSQPERLKAVAAAGEVVAPGDLRAKYYRAVAMVLKKERLDQAETLLREYVERAPVRNNYPHRASAHDWIGRLYEHEGKTQSAIEEYEAALKLDPKTKNAREALKRLKKNG
jgi:tetratricopeptide (TPR) repeat protein